MDESRRVSFAIFFLNETSINSKKFFKLKWNDFFIPFKRGEGFKEHHFLFVPL